MLIIPLHPLKKEYAQSLRNHLKIQLKEYFLFFGELISQINTIKPITYHVGIQSVILTYLSCIIVLNNINRIVRRNAMTDIKKIIIQPAFHSLVGMKNVMAFSWTVNTEERRKKRIHERHFWKLLSFLSDDIYLKQFISDHNAEEKALYSSLLTNQGLQRKAILKSLQKLEQSGMLVNTNAKDALNLITKEWGRIWVDRKVGKIILTRWKAMRIGVSLGLIRDSRVTLRPLYVFPVRLNVEEIIQAFEASEELEPGTMASKLRINGISIRRQFLIYILYHTTVLTEAEIGAYLGDRNHTAVCYALRKTRALIDSYPLVGVLLDYFCVYVDNLRIYKNREYFFPKDSSEDGS